MKVALVYSHSAKKTSQVAEAIKKAAIWETLDVINVEAFDAKILSTYDLLVLGAPTWFDGELPSYWDELIPAIEQLNLKKVKVAIFGNGDQVGYPENFGDAVGLLAEVFESSGAKVIGYTATDGYKFESSKALREGKFCGLILDFENQPKKNDERILKWISTLE